jgi:hypothetical protein
MIKTLIKHFKENPKEAILETLTALLIFVTGYAMLLFAAILNGNA